MQRFRFRLETLLKVRRRREEQAQLRLTQAIENLRQAQEDLSLLVDRIEAHRQEWQNALSQNKTIADFILYSAYFKQLTLQMDNQKEVVIAAEKSHLESLFVFQEAMKQRKVVERLKEKKRQQHYRELLQQEQNFLDELGTQRYGRDF
ncbi:MAG: flagellar export protein FliJ [Sporomusaceae bacterium]|nr:flagellar export protein FliJ [Sporomusaceae bacterium]